MLGYILLLLGVLSCIFCPYWITHAKDERDRRYGIFSMVGACIMLFCGIYIVSYENDILFFAQKQEYIDAKIDIDPAIVEPSSVLYLFDDINHQMTSIDMRELLGEPYKETNDTGGYTMKYWITDYTLNGKGCNFLYVDFNKSGEKGKIRGVRWVYEWGSTKLYFDSLDYLKTILGEPEVQSPSDSDELSAKWPGYQLYCTDDCVGFAREFR